MLQTSLTRIKNFQGISIFTYSMLPYRLAKLPDDEDPDTGTWIIDG
jgi:hypothetical protein